MWGPPRRVLGRDSGGVEGRGSCGCGSCRRGSGGCGSVSGSGTDFFLCFCDRVNPPTHTNNARTHYNGAYIHTHTNTHWMGQS